MHISEKGIALIVKYEGLVPYAYNDPVGHATFGVGHLLHMGPCTAEDFRKFGSRTNRRSDAVNRAKRILKEDLRPREDAVKRLVKVPLNQCEFDALVSLVFNIGEGNFASSSVLRLLNQRQRKEAGRHFLDWNKGTIGGHLTVLLGLTLRRWAERRRFRKRRCGPRVNV